MNKTMLPALSALGLLAACSGGAEAPKEEAATEATAAAAEAAPAAEATAPAAEAAPAAKAAANDDNDSAKPAADDHPHGDGEGEHKPH